MATHCLQMFLLTDDRIHYFGRADFLHEEPPVPALLLAVPPPSWGLAVPFVSIRRRLDLGDVV
jgi:hypothetical protein